MNNQEVVDFSSIFAHVLSVQDYDDWESESGLSIGTLIRKLDQITPELPDYLPMAEYYYTHPDYSDITTNLKTTILPAVILFHDQMLDYHSFLISTIDPDTALFTDTFWVTPEGLKATGETFAEWTEKHDL